MSFYWTQKLYGKQISVIIKWYFILYIFKPYFAILYLAFLFTLSVSKPVQYIIWILLLNSRRMMMAYY